ncbi:hypothetical protein [Amycolatopsis sp. CA-230715]|uniref:hypothetical protein n=1 Tax=Amycolatopsis sp. CA-230715 TaxID=2745196 RepID=UPI001C02F2D0|nr:hypothetical protein [Amycolatopsis sp. CA-230715]
MLDDGSEIPCECTFDGMLDTGEIVWLATPAGDERVAVARLDGVVVDDMPVGAVVHLGVKVDGWRCPQCGSVYYDPQAVREQHCGICRRNR